MIIASPGLDAEGNETEFSSDEGIRAVVDGEKMSHLNIYPPSRRGLEVCRRRHGSAG
jgi:hypothetical protein